MKTSNQVLNHHSNYGGKPQILSPDAKELFHVPHGEPIEIGLWGSAPIEFDESISLMTDVLLTNRALFIMYVYQKIENPFERFVFGSGLLFAMAFNNTRLETPIILDFKPGDQMRSYIELPGFGGSIKYTYSDCRFALSQALMIQKHRIHSLLAPLESWEAARIAVGVYCAEKCATADSVANLAEDAFDPPANSAAAAVIEQSVRWMDKWANEHIQELLGDDERTWPRAAKRPQRSRSSAAPHLRRTGKKRVTIVYQAKA